MKEETILLEINLKKRITEIDETLEKLEYEEFDKAVYYSIHNLGKPNYDTLKEKRATLLKEREELFKQLDNL